MHFKITARTILQLGAELISSDAIAFYELIKNAFDATSKRVTVRVVSRLDYEFVLSCLEQIEEFNREEYDEDDFIQTLKKNILNNANKDSHQFQFFKDRVNNADTFVKLTRAVKRANYILFSDEGEGMSLGDLEDIYLTIGTRNRRKQKANNTASNRPILGEKGLGRLSVMRLGNAVKIETTQSGNERFNELEIDWNLFSNDSDDLLESIDLEPVLGKVKENKSEQGTKIFIYDLKGDWSIKKLREIAKAELSKFIDPFEKKNRDFIRIWFNSEPVALENIDKTLFKYAHAIVHAKLEFDNNQNPILSGEIEYKLYDRSKTFALTDTHLMSVIGSQRFIELSRNLGPFKVMFYWFNRQMLTKKYGVLDYEYIKGLVNFWGGGLMVYRDGFRVNPYGGPNDDWLGLDPIALASPGYKLNRKQIVGKVDINTYDNPNLSDQTNREGLRENKEKETLVALLQYLIWKETKPFLEDVKENAEANNAVLSIDDIEKRVNVGQKQLRSAVKDLRHRYPVLEQEKDVLNTIESVLNESSELFKMAKLSSKTLENRLKTTLDLAGLGLMVDVIGHELNRSTEHALSTINSISNNDPALVDAAMKTLRSQLKTLQARLKVIDPLGPSGRQQKDLINLKKLIKDTVDSHIGQFERHQISFRLIDEDKSKEWMVRVVPGMIVQIVENLISNSVYWIKQRQKIDNNFRPEITIDVNRTEEMIFITDNGPGIPRERREEIFTPFFSTKPPKEAAGRGLGLYISRELAKYHDATLNLIDDNQNVLNKFVLTLKP